MTHDGKTIGVGRQDGTTTNTTTDTGGAVPPVQQPTTETTTVAATPPTTEVAENNELTTDELIALFPSPKLASLTMKISNPRWVVPVLPEQELECLLNSAIELTQAGVDHECEPCVRFYRDGLLLSFQKILTDDAVNSWKNNIHRCILMSCGKLMQLCALHMKRDNPFLLELLTMALDPENKFHSFNTTRQSEMYLCSATAGVGGEELWGTDDDQIFAISPPEPKKPRGWLVDLINRFGQFGGFDHLLERFNSGISLLKKPDGDTPMQISSGGTSSSISLSDDSSKMKTSTMSSSGTNSTSTSMLLDDSNKITLPLTQALLRPFGQCAELLTLPTIEKYFMPIWEVVLELLDNLSDDELKREAKPEGRSDAINGIVKAAKSLASRLPNQENLIKDLEMFRLKMILRLLQVSSFNGKMNALNEINKVVSTVSYYPQRTPHGPHGPQEDEMDWLTAEKMAKWIKETDVLSIVLRDSLHQPQYVEKLEKILRFLIKEKALTLEDLDAIWRAQSGKHEAIVKNVHDLLAKLAWDFNAEQLDYLFDCFQASMTTANKKQRERLLELIRHLAEDDKNGVMAHKVLKLFWSLAHSPEVLPEVLDQALAAHVKILDYSCSKERDAQKTVWLDKCVDELKNGEAWVLPALRLIREICCLYEAPPNHAPRTSQNLNRQLVIDRLQNEHFVVILVTNSLTGYMDRVRQIVKESPEVQPNGLVLDGRYPHPQQIQERLDFLKFLLKDGQLWLCAEQAKQIWQCLAVNAAFPTDREECFRWFGKLMGDEPDLDPGINRDFFEHNLLLLDPQLLTESGIKCFERFFKAVNSKEEKLKHIHRGYVLDDEDLIGKDYLWRVITTGGEEIAMKAIDLLKEVSTALGPRLQSNVANFHENFISECCDRMRSHYDNIVVLNKIFDETKIENKELRNKRQKESDKLCRVVRVLQEYIRECDRTYNGDRFILPLSRAHRGKHMVIYIRFQNPGRQIEDMEIPTHSNETIMNFKRNILKRIKGSSLNSIKVDLFYNSELIEIQDERCPLSQFNIFRDKMFLTAKLTPMSAGLASSPDSSSDSSTGSPPRPCPDVQKIENENTLPGVLICQKPQYINFFIKLNQLGCDLQNSALREYTRTLLHLLPVDKYTERRLQQMCGIRLDTDIIDDDINEEPPTRESLFLGASSAQVLYNIEVLHAILIPALDPLNDITLHIQSAWLHSGCAHFILELLTKTNFLANADMHTKRSAFLCVLRLVKLFLYIVGCILSRVGDEPNRMNESSCRSQIEILKQALSSIPGSCEHTFRAIATKLAQNLSEEMLSVGPEGDRCRKLFGTALKWSLPDILTIWALVQLSWAASTGTLHIIGTANSHITTADETQQVDTDDFRVCREALEILSISLVLNPAASDQLCRDPTWPNFVTSLVLKNPSHIIRNTAAEQLFLSCTYCSPDRRFYLNIIKLLVSIHNNLVADYAATCADFFQLFCRILNYGCAFNWPLAISESLLSREIEWLRNIKQVVKESGDTKVHEDLLEGRLGLTKELTFYITPELKSKFNTLIIELIDDFLYPASRQFLHLRKTGQLKDCSGPPPVCRAPHTIAAACDLVVALCQHSIPNMKLVVCTLIEMFCSDTEPLKEWEYYPPINPRPARGFSGLKNAGATCYMNSVLQQLYMIPSVRFGILTATGAATDMNEDFSGESDASVDTVIEDGNNRRNYHIGILKHVQAIFAHLAHSALQFYVPRGLWSHFKLQGEPVNLREQQDAVEFFMSLFESLDDGLKALGHQQLMGATLGGSFSDQKICQGCPHRYSKEEPFSVFSVDIRNHSSLTDSLEQYVKGELLEGADAYHCDKCDKKVVTIKRLCVRKLPPVLAIQLKRFEYDYERVCPIKFNDYFEFPRILDMEPYTVFGLAKLEGEVIDIEENPDDLKTTTKYQLTGIVVHSGQASGGHYFSYILHKDGKGREQWFKFDDGEVTECKMHEDEEMKAQCFGGDYMGEVYDNNLKRMQYRRQKRWWNAYMLFYTRCDQTNLVSNHTIEQLSLAESKNCVLPMPKAIEKSVRSQNIRFLHSRNLFSSEFFNFIRKLVTCSSPIQRSEKITPQGEDLSLLGIQLASHFLFHSGFRTKKTLRGAALDWYETLCPHIRSSSIVRRWFAQNALLNPANRLAEYILIAPSPEVRSVFVKLVVFFCHFAITDDPLPGFDGSNLCEQVLICVLQLLKTEVAEHGKHLPQYFSLFTMYAGLGFQEKQQLLKLNVPAIFMQVALDEGPGPPIKYQFPELCKLHQVVSHLIRSTDITSRCKNSTANIQHASRLLPNPYIEPNVPPDTLIPLQLEAQEFLFDRSSYIKKLIEDTNVGDEGLKLLQYCSWENPAFSRLVLTELLWQSGFAYWNDMRHHIDLLLNILLMEDSWQSHRIHNALMGIAEEREGLLDTLSRSKTHYQKRAYQIIKCLVQLFRKSRVALQMLNSSSVITRQWLIAVEWLQDELERQRGIGNQYSYSSWSPPAQSNDTTNGYMLERSQSAKTTLQLAFELCPEEPDEPNDSEVEPIEDSSQPSQTTTSNITDITVAAGNAASPDANSLQQQQQQQPVEGSPSSSSSPVVVPQINVTPASGNLLIGFGEQESGDGGVQNVTAKLIQTNISEQTQQSPAPTKTEHIFVINSEGFPDVSDTAATTTTTATTVLTTIVLPVAATSTVIEPQQQLELIQKVSSSIPSTLVSPSLTTTATITTTVNLLNAAATTTTTSSSVTATTAASSSIEQQQT